MERRWGIHQRVRRDRLRLVSDPGYSDWSWLGIYNNNVTGINGQVYFSGAMATVTWNGAGSGVWSLGGNSWSGTDMYGNNLSSYAWDNSEAAATFNRIE